MNDKNDDSRVYRVVRNDEGQYSIWATDRDPPLGWSVAGPTGSKEVCLAYIREVWTDLRPISVRT